MKFLKTCLCFVECVCLDSWNLYVYACGFIFLLITYVGFETGHGICFKFDWKQLFWFKHILDVNGLVFTYYRRGM